MEVKVIATSDELASICLNRVVDTGDIIDVQEYDDLTYKFDHKHGGELVTGWKICKSYVEPV